jgi:hypothetical protein
LIIESNVCVSFLAKIQKNIKFSFYSYQSIRLFINDGEKGGIGGRIDDE